MKKKGKTIKQHLQELPEPYNHMALENMHCFYTIKKDSAADALLAAFMWTNTDIDFSFWDAIYEDLLHLNK